MQIPSSGKKVNDEQQKEKQDKKNAKKKPINKISASRKQENKIYEKVKRGKKKKIQDCQIKSPVCINQDLHPHHVAGRSGPNFTNAKKVIMGCNPCNDYVNEHPGWAKAHGFTESRTGTPEKFQHLKKEATNSSQ